MSPSERATIESLRRGAESQGDTIVMRLCDGALAGDERLVRQCLEEIDCRHAMNNLLDWPRRD